MVPAKRAERGVEGRREQKNGKKKKGGGPHSDC